MPGRPLPTRTLQGLLVSGAALAVLTGCVAGSDDERKGGDAEPAPTATPVLLASADLRLPLQDYLLTDKQLRALDRARVVAVDQCMKRFGFDYRVRQPSGEFGPRSPTDRRYGITDAKLAAEHGYGLGDRDPRRQPRPVKPELGPDGETVLFGRGRSSIRGKKVPAGGCMDEAGRRLDASSPEGADPNLAQRLMFESFDSSRRDPQVRKVFKHWSDCMSGHGYAYADPLAPMGDPELGAGDAAAAIEVARTDIRCKKQTNLVGVWFTVESADQKRMVRQHDEELNTVKKANTAHLKTARGLTAGPTKN